MNNCITAETEHGSGTMLTSGMIVSSVILLGIVMIVLIGNSLVIIAVIKTRKLRTVTNIYIVSLACSDLLLGVCVLPYSASYEVLDFWPFGETWCSMWLAIDVLLCTASILNLCAISLDRFLAVTNPMKYPSLMSKRRGRILVSCVWILSFIISLPPLLWNDDSIKTHEDDVYKSVKIFTNSTFNETYSRKGMSLSNSTRTSDIPQCFLTATRWYRIYASMGSFYIPCFIMIFFYCRIYLTAVRTATSLKSGILVSKDIQQYKSDTDIDNEVITLRIHRGGTRITTSKSLSSVSGDNSPQSVYPDLLMNNTSQFERRRKRKKSNRYRNRDGGIIFEGYSSKNFEDDDDCNNDAGNKRSCFSCVSVNIGQNDHHKVPSSESPYMTRKNESTNKTGTGSNRSMIVICNGRTSQKKHIRKFLRETRAAKTVAIIIGAFILCWLPFFIIYLLGAFCTSCTPPLVFSILFWLGYCNSMLNPFIYGLFSRDFRFAFRRLLYCRKNKTISFCSTKKEPSYKSRHQLEIQILESESFSDF